MKTKLLSLILILTLGVCQSCSQRDFLETETKVETTKRMMWWKDAGVGMFIHWGLYSIPAGEYGNEKNHAEWIQETADITVEEYEKYAAQFNPTKYDAMEWVRIAKDAGMKYIVITSKHHDGFCLWDSKLTEYDIMDSSPFKRDILEELAEACAEEDIVLCFYHSIMDWHHPDAQGINHPDYNHGKGPNPNFSNYAENYMKPQLEELLSNYGNLGVLWFDGEWITEWTEEQGKILYNKLRNIQPSLLINNRVGKGRQGMEGMNAYEDAAGDFGTPEQEILEGSSTLDWESCMTMNDHWGFNKFDTNFKSTETIIHNLVDIAAKGGNYLLNVGPTAEGLIPAESVLRLKEMGEWMDINGEVIYSSRGAKKYSENDSTYYVKSKDDGYLYAIFTKWPGKTIQLKYAKPNIGSEIFMLGCDDPLVWEDLGIDGIKIELPSNCDDRNKFDVEHAWVIKMAGKQADIVEMPKIISDSTVVGDKLLFSDEILVAIKSKTEGAEIYYTLGEGDVSTESIKYREPFRVKESTMVKAFAIKDDFVSSEVSEATLLKAAKYKAVDFEYNYTQKYSGHGNLTVADGEFGDDDIKSGNWLGFEEVDIVANINLGETRNVETVSVNFLQSNASWIFLPKFIEISVSSDGENYKSVAVLNIKNVEEKKREQSRLIKASFKSQKVMYVKVKAENIGECPEWHKGAGGKAWLFIDEIIIE